MSQRSDVELRGIFIIGVSAPDKASKFSVKEKRVTISKLSVVAEEKLGILSHSWQLLSLVLPMNALQ